jgi:predicted ATPase/class 3 adenylate cyclase
MSELPSGTVTFLFTDLQGSTRLWQEHPEAMKSALAHHDEILNAAIVQHGGHIVKTTGDGVHAAFADAQDAMDAAIAGQVALLEAAWGATGPLAVRMGIHSGPAELRDGDYYGTTLNRAARLMSTAHGGQIVVSLATKELAHDGGVDLVDLGEHALRDLARPEHVFQVAHPHLERAFPRLRSLDAFVGNLPVQFTSFVGRDDEMARVVAMLDDASLVTLIGTGGVGKTRLAIQAAAEAVPHFADGAWFCELAAVDHDDAMAQVVASTLGCLQRAGLSLVDSIVEYVKVRELLLILDNCEHLLDEAGALAGAVLRACPKVTLIATSREALEIDGERVVRVRSLDAPEASSTGDELVHSAAVRLFADRATDAGATPTWNDAQWQAVGEICRRVDGIPLAIELAAARVSSMSPTDIAAHLDERFRLLTGKRRGRVERHQTLRATVEWSYQLLEDNERAVFDRLGVFPGTFDAVAAGAVAGGDELDQWEVVDAISSLVAKSLVDVEDGPDGGSRYSMLETLRQFAREQLDEAGEPDRWRRRHAEHYAAFAHDAGFGVTGPDEILWEQRARAEIDNVRSAVGWSLDRDTAEERELGVRIVGALAPFGAQDSAKGFSALAAQAAAAAESCRPELRAPVLGLAAYFEMNQGRVERARDLARRAIRDGVIATAPDPLGTLTSSVWVEVSVGNAGAALELGNEARAAFQTIDHPYAESLLLSGLAVWEAMTGQTDQARADADRAVELGRRARSPRAIAGGFHATAWALQRDDPAAALAAAEQFLAIYRPSSSSSGLAAGMLSMVGGLRSRLGDATGALEPLRESVLVARDNGARPQIAATLDWALGALTKVGRPEAAATFVGALTSGPLAEVGNYPGVDVVRARTLERVRAALGDQRTDACVARGAAMSYDEIVEYALRHLEPA